MKYCKKCLQPDTRPNIFFNKFGLCPACIYHNFTRGINYSVRYKKLKKILNEIKKRKKKQYL